MTSKKKGGVPASNKAVDALYGIAEEIYEELDAGQIPKMKIPLRTKANIRFDSKHAVWKYGNLMGVRSAKKLKGALMLLRTMYVLEFIRDMIRDSKSSTLREMYYISEGWDIAKFHAQEESNLLAEDLEVITQLLREDFKLRPEESGASVIGNLTLEEITRGGDPKRITAAMTSGMRATRFRITWRRRRSSSSTQTRSSSSRLRRAVCSTASWRMALTMTRSVSSSI